MPLLTTDLDRDDAVPYFLWDDPMTVRELRERLATGSQSPLDQVRIGDDATVPGEVSVPELRVFVHQLRDRLARLAFPGGGGR